MPLPASEDTRDDRMTFVVKENVDVINLTNDLGAAINQGDFVVIGPWCGVAMQDIAISGNGPVHVEGGIQVQADNLVTSEDTFGTEGQEVYFDASSKKFSDTETGNYYLVGYLVGTKDSNGMITFEKLRLAEQVAT
jgi:predicted RecA/RadA family phage recombinase